MGLETQLITLICVKYRKKIVLINQRHFCLKNMMELHNLLKVRKSQHSVIEGFHLKIKKKLSRVMLHHPFRWNRVISLQYTSGVYSGGAWCPATRSFNLPGVMPLGEPSVFQLGLSISQRTQLKQGLFASL